MKTKKKSTSIYEHIGIIVAIIGIAALSLLLTLSPKQLLKTISPSSPTYSKEEQLIFWDAHLKTLIVDQWAVGKLPYQEVNSRYAALHEQIIRQRGKPLQVSMITSYHWAGDVVEAAAGVNKTNNAAEVSLFIPSVMNLFKYIRSHDRPDWQIIFETHELILMMHETEHAAYSTNTKEATDIKEESRAWAETCRYTIAPLSEIYHLPLISTEGALYRAWKLSGGDVTSSYWRDEMDRIYGKYDNMTDKK